MRRSFFWQFKMHEQQLPRKVTEAIERECNAVDLALVVRDDPPKKEHPWRSWRGDAQLIDKQEDA